MQSNQLNDRWLSVLELEIKQEEELRIKIHEKFTFMQLNIGSNIKFKNPLKKDFQLGKSWWILFQVDVLSLKSNIFCKNLDKFFWERYVIEDQIKLNLGINLVSNKICIWRKVDKTIEPVLDFKIISNLNGWIRKQKHVNIGSILTEIKTIPFSILKKIK